ncbi:UvrB/UvrC motif-containing protein [Candidatus Peribacteria bacterium]|nr:UvrB/UvrC motif-containing protein [Candidatus Peribacteria bacterium]
MSELQNKMKLAAEERRYEDAQESKNTIQQIESA